MENKNFFKINIIYFISILSVAVIFAMGYFGLIRNEFVSTFAIQIMTMFAVPVLLYTLLVSKSGKKTFKDFGFRKISIKVIFISIFLGFILYILNLFVSSFFYGILDSFGYDTLSGTSNVKLTYGFLLKEFALSALLPGFCEEVLHRGLMLNAGKKSGNSRFCLIISSLLFGLIHLNIGQFFYASILGLFIGYLSLVTNSIYPSMIVHFMNNGLSIYFSYAKHLKWPFANLIDNIFLFINSNLIFSIIGMSSLIFLILWLYHTLTKHLAKQRIKDDVRRAVKSLNLETLPPEQAQEKINKANQILTYCNSNKFNFKLSHKTKFKFSEKIFLYSSILLGALITISSFIWGIM